MSDLSDKLRAAFEDDARVTAEDIIEVLDELEAVIRTLRGDIAVLYEALANSEERTVTEKYHDDLMHEWKVSEVAKDKRIAKLEADLDKYKTGAWSNPYSEEKT